MFTYNKCNRKYAFIAHTCTTSTKLTSGIGKYIHIKHHVQETMHTGTTMLPTTALLLTGILLHKAYDATRKGLVQIWDVKVPTMSTVMKSHT